MAEKQIKTIGVLTSGGTKKYCFADKEKGWFSYNFC